MQKGEFGTNLATAAHHLGFRAQSMKKAWWEMRRFLTSEAAWRVRKMVFVAKLVSAGLSATETYDLSKAERGYLGRKVVGYARKVAGARCVTKTGAHIVRKGNDAVLSELGMVPVRIELAIRRWMWIQSMVTKPRTHQAVINAIRGQANFERGPTVLPNGELNGDMAGGVNGFARMIEMDFELLQQYGDDTMVSFFEEWEAQGGKWRSLYQNNSVQEAFTKVDCRTVRGR